MNNRSQWLRTLTRHAAERPSAIAIEEVSIDGEITRTVTWREFVTATGARAAAMADVVSPGGTVLAAWPSGIDLATWFAGAIAAGFRLLLMHPQSGAGECAAACARAGVTAVLASDQLLALIRQPNRQMLNLRPTLCGSDHFADADARMQHGTEPGSIVLASSGTCGLPKLVVRQSAALDADACAVALGMSLTIDDGVLCVPPLCHSYGVDILLGTLLAGSTLRIMAEFDPMGAARQLVNGVTVLPGVPFVYESLARFRDRNCTSTDATQLVCGLRLALSAGSPLNSRVRREFTSRWKVEIGQLYGATELGTVSMSIPGEPGFDTESVGKPLPGVSFRVLDVDDSTRQLGPGQEGQLAVRAPSMLSGYIEADLSLIDGHLLTGDLARLDVDGRATITGRLKLLIDTGGFKVNPLEVEASLLEHPEVVDCAVVPLDLSDTVQRSFALIVARDRERPPMESELRGLLRDRLAPIKIPRGFEMVASLPRSTLGKLLRDQLPARRT